MSPPMELTSPPSKNVELPSRKMSNSPPKKDPLPYKKDTVLSPPKKVVPAPPIRNISRTSSFQKQNSSSDSTKETSPPAPNKNSPILNKSLPSKFENISNPLTKGTTSPPTKVLKLNKVESKNDDVKISNEKKVTVTKEIPVKTEKLSLLVNNVVTEDADQNSKFLNKPEKGDDNNVNEKSEEPNGVGDKIRKFEKAAEDASANVGRLSRPGSVRGRTRSEKHDPDCREDLPPPATPFKDHIFFDTAKSEKITSETNHKNNASTLERQHSINKGSNIAAKWQRNESSSFEEKIQKPEPQKIIKPEFKPMPSPVDLTIRSPSLGTKLPDQFPSQGTAFRNVASPDTARTNAQKLNEDNTPNNSKSCKFKNKEKYSVSKGSSYFTRGSEEIWLVKKKDIEEIEERVLDSFRRAGGNVCMRSESMRPSSDSGQSASFTHATMGRTKRPMYARSESLDPQWAGSRSQTLKRQSSIACTCGHDKKTRSKTAATETTPRLRSRSHGDENNQGHVLDKYETLV